MLIVYVDAQPLDNIFVESITGRANTEFVHLELENKLLGYLERNEVTLLLIGESQSYKNGLSLIDKVNKSQYSATPVIYIVNNEDDHYLENYYIIGIRDCIFRSDLIFSKIDRHLNVISEQKKLYQGMSNLSVAIVDDSAIALEFVSKILIKEGIKNIKTFEDPTVLLEQYSDFSLFIVDLVMPTISGDKLVTMIRKRSPNSIIITMSSVDNVKTVSHLLNGGADDYIVKPFHDVELMARIREIIDHLCLEKSLRDLQ